LRLHASLPLNASGRKRSSGRCSREGSSGPGTILVYGLVKLALVALVAGLVGWHIRRPEAHALEGATFVGSLAIVWLGTSLAH
jgi:hypothetical protein